MSKSAALYDMDGKARVIIEQDKLVVEINSATGYRQVFSTPVIGLSIPDQIERAPESDEQPCIKWEYNKVERQIPVSAFINNIARMDDIDDYLHDTYGVNMDESEEDEDDTETKQDNPLTAPDEQVQLPPVPTMTNDELVEWNKMHHRIDEDVFSYYDNDDDSKQ